MTPGRLRHSAETMVRRPGENRTRRTMRATRTTRSSAGSPCRPGMKIAAITTKSKTFQPCRKKSCGRLPYAANRTAISTTKTARKNSSSPCSAVPGRAQVVVRLQAENDAVGEDDHDDGDLEGAGPGELVAPIGPSRAARARCGRPTPGGGNGCVTHQSADSIV